MVVFILVSAHILFSLQITSYIRTIITKHKKVPEEFFLTDDQLEELDKVVSCTFIHLHSSITDHCIGG